MTTLARAGDPLILDTLAAEAGGEATPLLNVLGGRARIEGKFEVEDSLQVNCDLVGELTVGRRLVIGPGGTVSADVRTVDVVVMGRYEGNLVATGSVEIAATGRVTGHIETNSLVVAKGSFVSARVSRLEHPEADASGSSLYRLDARRAARSA